MKRSLPGIFITLEGTEGSGKSTLIQLLDPLFKSRGWHTLCTREPGGIPLAEKLREILLNESMNATTELLLYEAARSEHLQQRILPALQAGKIVFCDRFTDSTLAYQSYARGLPWKEVQALNQIATQKITPDLTLFLDIPPALGLSRVSNPNRFEAEGLGFHKKVRQGYLKAFAQNKKKWIKISVEKKTPEQVAEFAFRQMLKKYPKLFQRKKQE